jgi:hypothetical protein
MDSGKSLVAVRKEVASWIKDADAWPDARKAAQSEMAMLDGWKRTLATLDKAKSKADFRRADSGHFYTVDLPDEHIAKMLDYDKVLTEQPKPVKEALKKSGLWKQFRENASDYSSPQATRGKGRGSNFYEFLTWKLGSQEAASAHMNELGIPGIRYLDAGSRDAGRGTRNFVIFDGDTAKILKRE